MQLLGIRSLGTGYLYPALFDIRELESFLDSVSSRHFSQQVFDWRLSESESIKVELSGRKSLLRNHRVWIIYAQPYQATHQEQQQELAQLTIARSALDSLSELICTQDRQGNLLTTKTQARKHRNTVSRHSKSKCRAPVRAVNRRCARWLRSVSTSPRSVM